MIKAIFKSTSDNFNGVSAVGANCGNLGGRTFFSIDACALKDFPYSHTGNGVFSGKRNHGNKVNGIGFNDVGVLSWINFHGLSFV